MFEFDKRIFVAEEDLPDVYKGLDKSYFMLKAVSAALRDRADDKTAEIIDEVRDAVGNAVCCFGLLLHSAEVLPDDCGD